MKYNKNLSLILFAICIFSFSNSYTQGRTPSLEYTYDGAGNRISRQIVVLEDKAMQAQDSAQSPQQDSVSIAGNINQINEGTSNESGATLYVDNLGSRLIKLYPNPTYGVLTFQISPFPEGEKVEIRVFDQQNRFLFTTPCASEYTRVDLSGYATGVYLVYVAMGGQVSNWKIVKE